jgi:dipeptidase D
VIITESKVLHYFREINKIPRGSGNEKQISDWLLKFARDRNFEVVQDAVNNIIIKKPGTNGNNEPLIIQGHMDMVCEKNADKEHDFLRDPIKLKIDGDMVYADGTTLGADNGIAVAMALALLDSDDIKHPPLEIFLTVDEEVGMTGAAVVDPSLFSAKRLINLDSEEEGVFYTSCAGGCKIDMRIPTHKIPVPAEYEQYAVRVKGLIGGHSGMDIIKGGANSNKLLARVLNELVKHSARINSIKGGLQMNAIPRESEAIVFIPPLKVKHISEIIINYKNIFRNEYRITDPDITVEFAGTDSAESTVFDETTTRKILAAILLAPNGVLCMSADIPGLVEVSNNIGVVTAGSDVVSIWHCPRSSVNSKMEDVLGQIKTLSDLLDAEFVKTAVYPSWEYRATSPLRDSLINSYEKTFGKKPELMAVHAGLECGIISKKIPGADMISFGPDIFMVHSPDEHFSISSLDRTWKFLTVGLAEL